MSSESHDPKTHATQPRWPWVCLALAMIWVAVARVPLILNAETHLDSDLAVDGLTLLEATHGHWRWHFPGTPYMGIPPLLLALPQAMCYGANAFTITSGGVVAYELVVLSTFLLGWRVFGPKVAAWSLVPLAFASVGTVWLSGRLTGGHLLTVAWFASALVLFHSSLTRGGIFRAFLLGVWLGFGFYLDQMFLPVIMSIILARVAVLEIQIRWLRAILITLVFFAGLVLGDIPREIATRREPYDAYSGQFDTILQRIPSGADEGSLDWATAAKLGKEHTVLLATQCLPRLIAGHRVPTLASDPDPKTLSTPGTAGAKPSLVVAGTVTILSLLLFPLAVAALLFGSSEPQSLSASAVRIALILSGGAVVVGFVINRNIFNSDNYRYLVFLLCPWTLGVGITLAGLWKRGTGGRVAATALAILIATLFAWDTAQWYRGFGWIDDGIKPVRVPLNDAALSWLKEHPEVPAIFGDYWDVYRLAFLDGGRIQGVPYPNFPNRYDNAKDYPGYHPRLLIARPLLVWGPYYRDQALREHGHILYRERDVFIIDWPITP